MSPRERAKRALEGEWQRQQAVKVFHTAGLSMGAALPAGSSIRVCFHARPALKKSCLVYLRRGEHRVVHRLVFRLGPFSLEKGDANRYPRICWTRDILGVVSVAVSATNDEAAPVYGE